ncbi:MAG: hypothetical protein ABIR34_05220 [Marmoricola sp.]
MPHADWVGVRRYLTSAIEGLAESEFLVLGESCPAPGPRRGLFGRQPRPVSSRYVQALRIDDVLSAECVGATSLGGTWHMDDATIAQLCGMGWLTPAACEAAYGYLTPNFELYVELADFAGLSSLMVSSLAVLGTHPGSLVLECSSGGLSAVGG